MGGRVAKKHDLLSTYSAVCQALGWACRAFFIWFSLVIVRRFHSCSYFTNKGTERSDNLPRATQLRSGRARIRIDA